MYRFVPLSTETLVSGTSDQKTQLIGLFTIYRDGGGSTRTIFRQIGAFIDHGKIGAFHPVNSNLESYAGILVINQAANGGGGGQVNGQVTESNTMVVFNTLMPENFQANTFDLILNLNLKESLDKDGEKYLLISNTPTGINMKDHFVGHLDLGSGRNYPLYIHDGFLCLKLPSWPKLLTYPFWINQNYRIVLGEPTKPASVVFTTMFIVLPIHFEYHFTNRCAQTTAKPISPKPTTEPPQQQQKLEDDRSLGMIGRPFVPLPGNTLNETGQMNNFPPTNKQVVQLVLDAIPDFVVKAFEESNNYYQGCFRYTKHDKPNLPLCDQQNAAEISTRSGKDQCNPHKNRSAGKRKSKTPILKSGYKTQKSICKL